MNAVPVFLFFGGWYTVIVGTVTPVIHVAVLVGELFGSRTCSGPMGPYWPMPESAGVLPGQRFRVWGGAAANAGATVNKKKRSIGPGEIMFMISHPFIP